MAKTLNPDNFEKEMYKMIEGLAKKQFKPYLEKTYKKHVKQDKVKHTYFDGTEITKTVPDRLGKQVKTDTKKIAKNALSLETYSIAPPDDSILDQPIVNSSPTLFSEWVVSGDWFDLKSWDMAGRPDKFYHDDFKFPELPYVENAQTEIELNPAEIQKMIDDYFK